MFISRLLAEAESVSQQFDLKSIIQSNKHIPSASLENSALSSEVTNQGSTRQEEALSNRKRAEELVSELLAENGLDFQKGGKKHIHEEGKSGVKFNEDVTTVNITPRNMGRKVEELHQNRKKFLHHNNDSFVDLIEMKNRVEPVLSTGKAEICERENLPSQMKSSLKPPSGKASATKSPVKQTPNGVLKKTGFQNTDLGSRLNGTSQSKTVAQSRPRSASGPLNRVPKAITTVTVDYGENEPKETKSEGSKKKKGKKTKDDVLTMMQKLALEEEEEVVHKGLGSKGQGQWPSGVKDNDNDELNEAEFNKMFTELITAPTVYKSDPEKNYYEISRHSSLSNAPESRLKVDTVDSTTEPGKQTGKEPAETTENAVYKTTKTIEFNESNPKEVTVKTAIDPHLIVTKEKDKQTVSPDLRQRKSASRPSSAKVNLQISNSTNLT